MATGDIRVLAENYDALLRHCAYMRAMAVDETVKYGLGDWCAPFDGLSLYVNMTKFKCPVEVSDTAFRYAAVCASERWAGLLGRSQDEACLHAEAESIRAAFRKHFYDKQKNRVAGDCQSSTAMMLYYGFAEQDEIPGLVQRLSELIDAQNGHLDFERFGAVWTGEKSLADDWGPGLSQLSLLVGSGGNNALGMLEWERFALPPHVLRRFGLFLQIRWRYPSDGAGIPGNSSSPGDQLWDCRSGVPGQNSFGHGGMQLYSAGRWCGNSYCCTTWSDGYIGIAT